MYTRRFMCIFPSSLPPPSSSLLQTPPPSPSAFIWFDFLFLWSGLLLFAAPSNRHQFELNTLRGKKEVGFDLKFHPPPSPPPPLPPIPRLPGFTATITALGELIDINGEMMAPMGGKNSRAIRHVFSSLTHHSVRTGCSCNEHNYVPWMHHLIILIFIQAASLALESFKSSIWLVGCHSFSPTEGSGDALPSPELASELRIPGKWFTNASIFLTNSQSASSLSKNCLSSFRNFHREATFFC